MSNLLSLTSAQLKHAADLKDRIESLNKELASLLGSSSAATKSSAPKQRRKMSAGARAKIAAAQKARWAKVNAGKPAAKKKSKMSASAKARLSAAAKARWAKVKAAGKTKL